MKGGSHWFQGNSKCTSYICVGGKSIRSVSFRVLTCLTPLTPPLVGWSVSAIRELCVFFVIWFSDSVAKGTTHMLFPGFFMGLFTFHSGTWSPEGCFCLWVGLALGTSFSTSPRGRAGTGSTGCTVLSRGLTARLLSILSSIFHRLKSHFSSVRLPELNALIQNPSYVSHWFVMRIGIT